MKSKILALCLSSLTLFSCTETETPQNPLPENQTTVITTKVSNFPSDYSLPGENQIDYIEAYLFNDGKLQSILGELSGSGEGKFNLTLPKEVTGKVYFIANCDHTLDAELSEGSTTEEVFLKSVSNRNLGTSKQHILTGVVNNISSETVAETLNLKRGVARIDLKITGDHVALNKITVKQVAQSGYIFEQSAVSTPEGTQYSDVSKTFNTPNTTGEAGLFYFYEQANDKLDVILEVTCKDTPKTINVKLPNTLKRNTVYTVHIKGSDEGGGTDPEPNPDVTIEVSTTIPDWENGGDIPAEVEI